MATGEKKRVSIIIGVTGHRILTEIDKIEAGVWKGLDHIEKAYPGQSLTLLSPLAEGADCIVARQILARPQARLIVPLPLPQADYLTDFESAESREEFLRLLKRAAEVIELPAAPTRNAAYEAVGHHVIDRCDVLIAIWDGQSAQGQGGTGEMVARARAQGKPVVIVRAGNRKPGTKTPTTLGKEQGRVILEGLPGSAVEP